MVDGGADGVDPAHPVKLADVNAGVLDARRPGRAIVVLHALQGPALLPRVAGSPGWARADGLVVHHRADGAGAARTATLAWVDTPVTTNGKHEAENS